MAAADTAIVDIDGTPVDTNYHHALAWSRAFRRFDFTHPVWQTHRNIGMGGDQLVRASPAMGPRSSTGRSWREAWTGRVGVVGVLALAAVGILVET